MLLLAPIVAANLLGGFGHFPFGHSHTLPAFELSPSSFVARAPNALAIRLGPERAGIVVEQQTRFGKTISLRPAGNAPVRIDYETTSLGFSLRYVNGMEWTAEGESPPFITWSEGTVGPGVPAAAQDWALLTWRNERPPLLLVFSNPVSLTSERTDTGFRVISPRWTGTVSVRLPFGTRSASTSQAADFGKLLQELRPLLPLITKPAPKPVSADVAQHVDGYEVTVRFDSPGAILPRPAVDNPMVRVVSPLVENGPEGMPLCATDQLRFVVSAPGEFSPGMPVIYRAMRSESDGIENRLLAYMTGNSTMEESAALGMLAAPTMKTTEPLSNTALPLALDGSGSSSAALRGLELAMQGKEADFVNALFASIDWATWMPAGGTSAERAEAAALLSIAGLFDSKIENRALAAMANSAIVGTTAWDEVRNAAYRSGEKPAWYAAMRSPIRVVTPGVISTDVALGIELKGNADTVQSRDVAVRSDAPIEVVAMKNIARTLVVGTGEVTTIRIWPQRAGQWTLTFRRSAAGSPIPKAAPSPRYSAIQR